MSGRRVLITGIATRLGTELARRLERDPSVDYVAGLDVRPPRARLDRTDFIDADIRSPDCWLHATHSCLSMAPA